MNTYYAFISGLPELKLAPEREVQQPAEFYARLKEVLAETELRWAELLWMRGFHNTLVLYAGGRTQIETLPFGWKAEMLEPENEQFQALPAYLREWINWQKQQEGSVSERTSGQKLQELYFSALHASGNRFLEQWGEWELNRVNYLAFRRSGKSADEKKRQLVEGNSYYELLLDFNEEARVVTSEFGASEKLKKLSDNTNLQEREKKMDALRWAQIDEINRFEYFSVDVILGYLQKLMIIDRWTRIHNPEKTVVPEELAEAMVRAYDSSQQIHF